MPLVPHLRWLTGQRFAGLPETLLVPLVPNRYINLDQVFRLLALRCFASLFCFLVEKSIALARHYFQHIFTYFGNSILSWFNSSIVQ